MRFVLVFLSTFFANVAAADIVYFIGGAPGGPYHLMSMDTVNGVQNTVVLGLHQNDSQFSRNLPNGIVFNETTGNVHYMFTTLENGMPAKVILRSVNLDTKAITDHDVYDTRDPSDGPVPISNLIAGNR